jgi:lipopolysaccharide export system permease protein
MKAAGLSAHQVLAPLLLTAAAISVVSFTFNEVVVTRATGTLKAWQAVEYKPIPPNAKIRANVYLPDGPHILTAGAVSGTGKLTRMDNVTWYRRDGTGMVLEQIRAPRATYANPGWRLDQPVSFDVRGTRRVQLPPTVLAQGITPAQVAISKVDPDGQNFIELYHSIQALKAQGRRTGELEGKWWHKFSGPLAALLMPLLGAIAAFGLARSGQLLIRAIIGMALGFAYFVIDNAALAMGNFGGYPPLIAAWAPFLLFALVGETVLVRTEE